MIFMNITHFTNSKRKKIGRNRKQLITYVYPQSLNSELELSRLVLAVIYCIITFINVRSNIIKNTQL